MTRSRSVVAALLLLLFAQAAAGECLTPPWELRSPALPSPGLPDPMMVVGDFDEDGIADAVFVRLEYTGHTVTLQRGTGNGFFAAPVDIRAYLQPVISQIAAKDLNRDGKLDLLFLENRARLVFLPGNGDGTFANHVISSASVGTTFAMADMNGDDADDVVAFYNNANNFGLVVFAGSFLGTFVEVTRFALRAPSTEIAAGDLDGDGANDLVIGYGTTLDLLFGNGDGTFDPPISQPSNDTRPGTFKLADLENDGDLDIVTVSSYDRVTVHRNRGGRIFDAVTTYWVQDNYSSVKHQNYLAVADVNGDEEPDLLVANSNTTVAILRGLGDGTFDAPHSMVFPGPKTTWAPIEATDFDGDGRVDIIIGPTFSTGLRAIRNRCGDANVVLTAMPPAVATGQSVLLKVSAFGYHDELVLAPPVAGTGTVSILAGTTVLATGTLLNGDAWLTVPGLAPGAHKLVARYDGDDQYKPAQSAPIIVRVMQVPTTTPPPRRRAVGR